VGKDGGGSVNGGKDRWVGFGGKKGGYKMLGDFEIGLFREELFVMLGVMDEAKNKGNQMKVFKKDLDKIKDLR
ncbi:DUF1054 family protein, partial [Staphylococcus capitis]|uniref:DUF1054 family protein n=1 Tax=Staphylococcus capitis TaxID=29388 RepID=UPI00119D987B